MIIKAVLLFVLTLANLFLLAVSVHYWKTSEEKANKVGFGFLTLLTVSNIISTVGGVLW